MATVLSRKARPKLLLFFLLLGLLAAASVNGQDSVPWQAMARELRSESPAAVEKASRDLRRIPGLEAELRASLGGPDQAAALEVVSRLGLKSLAPDLIKLGRGENAPWRFIPTLASLVDSRNKDSILSFFEEKLATLPAQEGAASKIVVLETLARFGIFLQATRLERLLKDPSYEVRIAAVEFAGRSVAAGGAKKHPEYLPVLKAALSVSPYQARLAALRAIERLPLEARGGVLPAREQCERETRAEVRDLCRALTRGGRSK